MSSPVMKRKRESDDEGESGSDHGNEPDLLQQYDSLMRSTWGHLEREGQIDACADGAASDADVSETAAEKAVGVGGAKRRKMDKKKLKREEQKRLKAETIDAAEFRLFKGQSVKPISLLPAQLNHLSTTNPRHTWLDAGSREAIRARCLMIAIEGSTLQAASAKLDNAERYGRARQNKMKVLPAAVSVWSSHCAPSSTSLAVVTTPRSASRPLAVTLLGKEAQPPLHQRLAAGRAKIVFTKAEKKEVEAWRKARDERLGVSTRSAQRGGTDVKLRASIASIAVTENKQGTAARPRREAKYYAPPVGIGGKARGYGWGYLGSREGSRDNHLG